MRKLLVVGLFAVCSSVFAGPEMPARFVPRAIPAPRTVIVERPGILGRAGTYLKNRLYDVGDVLRETGDAVVGLVGVDICGDDDQ